MPRNSRPAHVDEALRRRTELAIKLAHDWMAAMNMSQRGLSRRLDVDQSILSRFLSQQPGYEPGPRRPRILKLLEDIEQFCTQVEDVSSWQEDGIFESSDVVRVWWRAHTHRLRALRQSGDPARTLLYVTELVGQALHFPLPYRPHACVNAELAISVALFQESSSRSCSDELIRRSLGLVDALKAEALRCIPELDVEPREREEHVARATNYAGVSRSYGGARLNDRKAMTAGVRELIESTRCWNRPVTRVWHNALHFMEFALEQECSEAHAWCMELVEQADVESESFRVALSDHALTRVKGLLSREAPNLLDGE